MASLSYRSAAKIAAREMHSSRGKFFFVILSVAIGVAALTGVRGFSASFRSTLLNRARSIMAADLSARMFQQPTPEQQKALDEIAGSGVEITPVTELLSMASAAKTLDPLLVSIKSVDPGMYPFYGEVELAPAAPLKAVLTAETVAVADDLLVRLNLKVGDQLKIGTQLFRIASVVVNEPDRLSSSFAAGPRVLISREGLEASGLLAPGSRAGQRYLFKVPKPRNGAPISDKAVADLKARLEKLLPEAQIIDYRETNPALTQGLDRATSLLSLMSLVALVLGAAGGVLGVGLGVGVQLSFPYLLAKLIHVDTELHVQLSTVLTGLAVGILTTLLFTLPPLLDIRAVRPILILRRAVDDNDDPFVAGIWRKITKNLAQIGAAVLILAGLAAIATTLSDSVVVGQVFSLGLVGVLGVLLCASAAVLAGLRFFLSKTR